MNKLIKAVALSGLLLATGAANAGTAKVYWDDPTGFTDINAGVQSQPKFTKRVIEKMNEHFSSLAEDLPKGYTWHIQVADVDLAGKVSTSYFPGKEGTRTFDTFFNPSMTFSYLVKDQNGKIVAGDKLFKLTDVHVKRYPSSRFMQRPLSYDKYMVKAWFKEVLLPFVRQS